MKNKAFSRILTLALTCILLLPVLASCSIDNSDYFNYLNYLEENCIKWTLSDSGKLVGGEKTYYEVELDCNVDPMNVYMFHNSVYLRESHISASVEAPCADSEIVWIYDDSKESYTVYATENGTQMLKEFENGDYHTVALADPDLGWSCVDLSLLETLDAEFEAASDKIKKDVTELKDAERLDVRIYDSTESFYKVYGALYILDGGWYYINYDSLGNEYFDADGNFSYRRGTVELCRLSIETSYKINDASGEMVWVAAYTYEEDSLISYEEFKGEDDSESTGILTFWVVYSTICFALPAAFAVLGCVLARSEKLGKPKYWYILSLIALFWIVLSVILMILLLL